VEKLIVDPHPDPDQQQNLITSKGSPLAHAYHVWSTSVNAFMSYPVYRQTERQHDTMTDATITQLRQPSWSNNLNRVYTGRVQTDTSWSSGLYLWTLQCRL